MDIVCGNNYSLAITTSGHAFSWGTNSYGALGLGPKTTCASKPTIIEQFVIQNVFIIKISARHNHSLFISKQRRVFGCGKSDMG